MILQDFSLSLNHHFGNPVCFTIVPTVSLSNLQLRFASVITIMDDKFCLKWNEYDTNIRESFKKLRQDQRFFDVTLATEDGQQIQANKLILSAGSQFFNDIFVISEHTNVLVYLKGIRSEQLEHVLISFTTGKHLLHKRN